MDAQKLEKIIEISRNLSEERMLEPLLQRAMTTALDLLNGEYGYLILLSPTGEMNFRVRQDRHGGQLSHPEAQVSHTIFDQVITQRKPLLTADALMDPSLHQSDSVIILGLRSVVCVPLIVNERMLGAVYMENRSDREIFNKDDLRILEYFAAQLAVSIENASLNAELESRVEERTEELRHALEEVTRYSGELMRANTELEFEITTRRQAEDQLRKLSRVIEQSSNGVLILDAALWIEYCNPSFATLTGYTAEDIIGKTITETDGNLGLRSITPAEWQELAISGSRQKEIQLKKKSGEKYWERMILTAIRNTEGVISHYAIIKEDITLKKLSEAELSIMASTDPLTGILNRRQFFVEAEKAFHHSLRYREPLTILMVDADHFKSINDNFGHQTGDAVLKALVRLLSRNIRAADTLGRYGGEEFIVLMPGIELPAARIMANRLCMQIAGKPIQTEYTDLALTISIGVAAFNPTCDINVNQIVEKADKALYAAKNNGRNRVEVWTEQHDSLKFGLD